MSTRCQIGFYENNPGSPQIALIYQHYDGDPKTMLPKLIKIHQSFKEHRGYYDPSYLAARTLQKLMNESDKDVNETIKESFKNEMLVTGFGIDNELHADLSHFYQIYENLIIVDGKKEYKIT